MTKVTAEELKVQFEKAKNQPLPKGLTCTCICGKHTGRVELSDEDYQQLADILNGESQTTSN